MTITSQIKSFYKRRINIPVKKGDLVLDIGSGDKPHWRADVLVDLYTDNSYGIQRSGDSKVKISKSLVVSPIEKLPFKDKSFDYVICSHVLEHVIDPQKSLVEIMRVGKAGYIEVPFEGASKVVDYPSHLWYCRLERGVLVFTAKHKVAFDSIIDSLMQKREMFYGFANLGQKYWDDFVIELYWKDKVKFRVAGKASKNLFEKSKGEKAIHIKRNFFLRNVLNGAVSMFFWRKKNGKVDIQMLMQCPECRSSLALKGSMARCKNCAYKTKILLP